MAWYYGTFSCGHEGRVDVIGRVKDRQWKADRRFDGLCPECFKKKKEEEREQENLKAAKESKEMDLPELVGSEKQVAWANTLRLNLIEKFDKLKKGDKYDMEYSIDYITLNSNFSEKEAKNIVNSLDDILEYILLNKINASFFINNRDCFRIEDLFISIYKEMKTKQEKEDMKDIINESTLMPKEVKFGEVVEIKYDEKSISAIYERNDTFIKIVKALHFRWNGTIWSRKITEFTGGVSDRVAELGNKLLNAGFSVLILGENERRKAIIGEYEPECDRWIKRRTNYNKFAIVHEYNDSLYRESKKLPNAKYDDGSMLVDISYYKEVEEFAKLYNFKFSKAAITMIEKYKEELENKQKVEPIKVD